MKIYIFPIIILFFIPFLSFAQDIDSLDADNEKLELMQQSTEVRNSMEYGEFLFQVSKKNLNKKYYWIDKNNIIAGMYLINYDLDSIEFHILDYIEKDPIHACDDIVGNTFFNFKKKYSLRHKKIFYHKIDCLCKEEWAKLDSNLIRLLVVIDSFDQKYRKSSNDAPWLGKNKDKWIEQGHYDIYNQVLLECIFKNYGYPSYRKVGMGNEISTIAFSTLLHCNIAFQEKHLPLIKKAAEKDDIPKHFYAQMTDRIQMLKGKAQIYGTQLTWNKKSEVLELYQVKDMTKVDKLRKEVGLKSLAKYLKSENAIIPTKKNK
jgi:hypothetical protein